MKTSFALICVLITVAFGQNSTNSIKIKVDFSGLSDGYKNLSSLTRDELLKLQSLLQRFRNGETVYINNTDLSSANEYMRTHLQLAVDKYLALATSTTSGSSSKVSPQLPSQASPRFGSQVSPQLARRAPPPGPRVPSGAASNAGYRFSPSVLGFAG
ncbi:hypothetical protein HDE_08341 [Halotydeus destructor]|nr:hypothetical protein HDE_08341 [Halotydeus destructor]